MSETRTGIKFLAWRSTQGASPRQSPEKLMPDLSGGPVNGGGRKTGFPSSMFQRGAANGWQKQPVIADSEGVRPSPAGWILPLEPANEFSSAVAGNVRSSPAVITGQGSSPALPLGKKAAFVETIDSRDAAKKYGGRFMV